MYLVAKNVAIEVLSLANDTRAKVLAKLKEENAPLHALVCYQLKRLRKEAKANRETEDMARNVPARGLRGTKLIHFDKDGKLYTLEAYGMAYKQHMATGELTFDKLVGTKEAADNFIKVFSVANADHMVIVVSSTGEKIVFQPPIAVYSSNSSTEGKNGKILLDKVVMRFIKEVITLALDDKETGDDT